MEQLEDDPDEREQQEQIRHRRLRRGVQRTSPDVELVEPDERVVDVKIDHLAFVEAGDEFVQRRLDETDEAGFTRRVGARDAVADAPSCAVDRPVRRVVAIAQVERPQGAERRPG